MKLPYSAGALEPIWSLIPKWLGYDLWFFNGIHRPRKDFLTYQRNDDIYGIVKYLNSYYKKSIKVTPQGDFLNLKVLKKSLNALETKFSKTI